MATLIAASAVAAAQPAPAWERTPLPRVWRGYTHAQGIGDTAYFLHGRAVEVLDGDGRWHHLGELLPAPVGAFSATAVDPRGRIVVVPGSGRPGFVLDPTVPRVEAIPGLALDTGRGAMLAFDPRGVAYCLPGGRRPAFGRVEDGVFRALPETRLVNPAGGWSSGLFAIGEVLVAFGDHHVSVFDPGTGRWRGWGTDLFCLLGMRPAIDRGGMFCQDPATGAVFMTLGKRSRSIGVLLPERVFFHLRPRLPLLLEDVGRTLFLTVSAAGHRLGLLSQVDGAIHSIAATALTPIGVRDLVADVGSPVEVWNSRMVGSFGDLVRERDSVANMVLVPPWVYVQRKNVLRRFRIDTFEHSRTAGHYGDEFCVEGAAMCHDGAGRLYLYNGYADDFWAVELYRSAADPDVVHEHPVDVDRVAVRSLAEVPAFAGYPKRDRRGRNTPMAWHRGAVYALFEPIDRILYRYDPAADSWSQVGVVGGGIPYGDADGADMWSDGSRLWLLSGDALAWCDVATGVWSAPARTGFRFSADGGMSAFDAATGRLYVVLGGGSRDLGVVRVADGRCKLHRDFFPDAVSVHGRRAMLHRWDGETYLCLHRGHDTAEFWRVRVSGAGAPGVE